MAGGKRVSRMKGTKFTIDWAEVKRMRAEMFASDPERRRIYEANVALSRPILDELREQGYKIEDLDHLKYNVEAWQSAIPVLLHWLPRIEDLHTKETIVRLLSVPWSGSDVTEKLIEDFKTYATILPRVNLWVGKQIRELTPEERKRAPAQSLAWALGNALSIVDVRGFEGELIELCRNPKFGTARQMIVWSLNRLRHPEAETTAIHLLDDEDVSLQAIITLGKTKSMRALPKIETLLTSKAPGIAREARKAIARIMRRPAAGWPC